MKLVQKCITIVVRGGIVYGKIDAVYTCRRTEEHMSFTHSDIGRSEAQMLSLLNTKLKEYDTNLTNTFKKQPTEEEEEDET